jgi:hypothetical protein
MPSLMVSLSDHGGLKALDAAIFQTVDGFAVRLRDCGELGHHLHFCDGLGNSIASFPWLDHADACLPELFGQISGADVNSPFHDLEEGWEILIWQNADHFFVCEGRGDPFGEFGTLFRVHADAFIAAWTNLLSSTRATSFRSLSEALRQPELVQTLLLGNSQLETLPPELFSFVTLEHLDLYLNRLTTLPPQVSALTSLRWLDLRFNQVESLPPELSRLPRLESINLAENRLTEIPEWVAHMPALRVFYVAGNPIGAASLERARRSRPDLDFLGAMP